MNKRNINCVLNNDEINNGYENICIICSKSSKDTIKNHRTEYSNCNCNYSIHYNCLEKYSKYNECFVCNKKLSEDKYILTYISIFVCVVIFISSYI
jgi:hypothetical protein